MQNWDLNPGSIYCARHTGRPWVQISVLYNFSFINKSWLKKSWKNLLWEIFKMFQKYFYITKLYVEMDYLITFWTRLVKYLSDDFSSVSLCFVHNRHHLWKVFNTLQINLSPRQRICSSQLYFCFSIQTFCLQILDCKIFLPQTKTLQKF